MPRELRNNPKDKRSCTTIIMLVRGLLAQQSAIATLLGLVLPGFLVLCTVPKRDAVIRITHVSMIGNGSLQPSRARTPIALLLLLLPLSLSLSHSLSHSLTLALSHSLSLSLSLTLSLSHTQTLSHNLSTETVLSTP